MNVTRRAFLGAAGVGAANCVLRPQCVRAADRELPPLRWAVVSDTHLGYHDQKHAAEQWQRAAAELAAVEADCVLHLGDIVDRQRESQYPAYLESRAAIGKPVHEIPGNHDAPEHFAAHIRSQSDAVVDHQWLRFLLLGNARTESHDGFLSRQQLDWIAHQCRQAEEDDRLVAICMHVPARTNGHPDRGWYVKPESGQKELYEIVNEHADRVLCLMHGHFHNGLRGWNDHGPVHEIVFPSLLYNHDRRLMEQNAAGFNPPEFRPGYTLVTVQNQVMVLQYRPLGSDACVEHRCPLQSSAFSRR